MTGETAAAHSSSSWARRGRLILKELRETLRDRRTILTLLLMPILAYPLLGMAFQRLLISQIATSGTPEFVVAFPTVEQNAEFERIWANAIQAWEQRETIRRRPSSGARPETSEATPAPSVDPRASVSSGPPEPMLTARRPDPGVQLQDVEHLLSQGVIDIGIIIEAPPDFESATPSPGRIRLVYVDRVPRSMEAYRFVLERLETLNNS